MVRHSHIALMGLALALAGAPVFVEAQAAPDPLVVEFENTPLFDEANFLPGDDVTRFAKVTNNADEAKDIAVEAINTSDPDGLGDVLIIKIAEGATTLYEDTLADFFGAGQFTLSELAGDGTQTQYDFTVRFEEGAENVYEEKTVGFDILIGFLGEGGGAGGGGGGSVASGLVIKDEVRVINIGETSATVEWPTSYLATSQVIYAAEGEAHILDLSDNLGVPPTYGYAHTTAEFDMSPKVIAHSVLVGGLTPGTTYYLRTVSHASPPTITREYTFATLSFGEIGSEGEQFPGVAPEPKVPQEGFDQAEEGTTDEGAGTGEGSSFTGGDLPETEGELSEEEDTEGLNAFLASVGIFDIPLWLAVVLAIIVLLFFLLLRKRKKRQDER